MMNKLIKSGLAAFVLALNACNSSDSNASKQYKREFSPENKLELTLKTCDGKKAVSSDYAPSENYIACEDRSNVPNDERGVITIYKKGKDGEFKKYQIIDECGRIVEHERKPTIWSSKTCRVEERKY